MPINTVAILSPGDMGHAVGRLLKEHELRVITCLTGRSERTKGLAEIAGIEDIEDFDEFWGYEQQPSLKAVGLGVGLGRARPLPPPPRQAKISDLAHSALEISFYTIFMLIP